MDIRGTTIIAVRKGDSVAMAGDGQVTFGTTVMKGTARKVRRMYDDRVIVGFEGESVTLLALIPNNSKLKSTLLVFTSK